MAETLSFEFTVSRSMLYLLVVTIVASLLTLYIINRSEVVGDELERASGSAAYQRPGE